MSYGDSQSRSTFPSKRFGEFCISEERASIRRGAKFRYMWGFSCYKRENKPRRRECLRNGLFGVPTLTCICYWTSSDSARSIRWLPPICPDPRYTAPAWFIWEWGSLSQGWERSTAIHCQSCNSSLSAISKLFGISRLTLSSNQWLNLFQHPSTSPI